MDISSKISDLQCSWFKKLYDQNFHEWKLIPIHFINNAFGKNFIFHSNLSFKTSVLQQFLTFYVMILQSWTNISEISHTHSCLGSQFLWLDKYITTDNNYFRFKEFWVTLLTLAIIYSHPREQLRIGIALKKNQHTNNLF